MSWRQSLSSKEPSFPKDHNPFIESDKGFSCSVCDYFQGKDDKGVYHCSNEYYKKWKGDDILEIKDPTKWCSDWFEPEEKSSKKDSKDEW